MNSGGQAPEPRRGMAGLLDRFIGPGASRAELVLQFSVPVGAAIAAPFYAAYAVGGWSLGQYFLCALLAFDVVGGILTNATRSGKRWYHRAGQGARQHFLFVVTHLAHLLLVAWAFLALDMVWFVAAGSYLLAGAAVILLVPAYLQRAIALLAYAGAVVLSIYGLTVPEGLEWFLPLFYLKILVAHLPDDASLQGS